MVGIDAQLDFADVIYVNAFRDGAVHGLPDVAMGAGAASAVGSGDWYFYVPVDMVAVVRVESGRSCPDPAAGRGELYGVPERGT